MNTHFSLSPVHLLAALFLLPLLAGCSLGETVVDAAERGVERATEREVRNRADRATTGVIEGFENAARCAVGDTACRDRARAEGRDIVYVDEDGEVVDTERNAPENVARNYDFMPGSRVLFEEDFSSYRTGEFPQRLRYGRGSIEVVDWNGRKLLSNTAEEGWFDVPLREVLPDRFTLEFDFHDSNTADYHIIHGSGILFGPVATREDLLTKGAGHTKEAHVRVGSREGSGVWRDGSILSGDEINNPGVQESLVRIEIQVDGNAIKVYANRSNRIANVPQIEIDHGNAIKFTFESAGNNPIYIGNIRVAASE